MTKLVICKVSIPGFHKWEEAPDSLAYLRSRHRHVFEIEVGIQVTNNNREIEIISTQNTIQKYLLRKYGENSVECEFYNMSCEDIAEEILKTFHAYYVTVTEDGFGGSTIINSNNDLSEEDLK